jgi:hypothetical protein
MQQVELFGRAPDIARTMEALVTANRFRRLALDACVVLPRLFGHGKDLRPNPEYDWAQDMIHEIRYLLRTVTSGHGRTIYPLPRPLLRAIAGDADVEDLAPCVWTPGVRLEADGRVRLAVEDGTVVLEPFEPFPRAYTELAWAHQGPVLLVRTPRARPPHVQRKSSAR